MARELLFITVGNENNQDIDITHGSRSFVQNQTKKGRKITEKVFEKDNFNDLSQQSIENIFILAHGTDGGIGDDTPKAFAKKFARKFSQVQKEQVKHLYVYACGLGQVINNTCKAKQLADALYSQGFKNITVYTIISPPDIEPGAEMISATYSRIGIFGNGLEVGGGYSSWTSKSVKDIIEANNQKIEHLKNEKDDLNEQIQAIATKPMAKNRGDLYNHISEIRQEILRLRKENSRLQSKATYFAKNNDLIQEIQQPHNQFRKDKPLTENIEQASLHYSKIAKITVSEDDLNKQFAIEAIKQRVENLKEKAERVTQEKGKYKLAKKLAKQFNNNDIADNKRQRAERLEKLLKDIAENPEWKSYVRKASEDEIFKNMATKAKSKLNEKLGMKLPSFNLPLQDKSKQLLDDILNDKYPSKAIAAVNAELNPIKPAKPQPISQIDPSSDSGIKTKRVEPNSSEPKKVSTKRTMGVKVLPQETSSHVAINKNDSSSDSETAEVTPPKKKLNRIKKRVGFKVFPERPKSNEEGSSSDSENEASALISHDSLRQRAQPVQQITLNRQVDQWLKRLSLDEQAEDVEDIRQKKAEQLEYFDRRLNKTNFNTEQLMYLTKVLHQFQLTGDKSIVGDNFDLIRTERNSLRCLDINSGNTTSWQKLCHGVKATLLNKLKDEYSSNDTQKTTLPADIYKEAEKVLRQRTGRFLSSSSLFNTSSVNEFYNHFNKETQALGYNTSSKK